MTCGLRRLVVALLAGVVLAVVLALVLASPTLAARPQNPPPEPRLAMQASGVTLSAEQLQINQRISQAAIRRAAVVRAHLDGDPPPTFPAPEAGAEPRFTLGVAQLRINQRIAQEAVRRANALTARVEGRPSSTPPVGGGAEARFTLSATQLLINQRIAQAAVRRVNALVERLGVELPTPAPAPELVVRVSGRTVDLDGFRSSDTLLGTAIARFGTPDVRRPNRGAGCEVRWNDIGLRILFADFGASDACGPSTGNAQVATLRAPWRTARGLAVGEPVDELRRLYPGARVLGDGRRELTSAFSPIGAGGEIPILTAAVRDGRVVDLMVFIGGAGD